MQKYQQINMKCYLHPESDLEQPFEHVGACVGEFDSIGGELCKLFLIFVQIFGMICLDRAGFIVKMKVAWNQYKVDIFQHSWGEFCSALMITYEMKMIFFRTWFGLHVLMCLCVCVWLFVFVFVCERVIEWVWVNSGWDMCYK